MKNDRRLTGLVENGCHAAGACQRLCLAPVAAYHDGETLTALVADENGAWLERRSGDDPEALGRELLSLIPT